MCHCSHISPIAEEHTLEVRENDSESEEELDPDEEEHTLRQKYFHEGKDSYFYFGKDKTKWRIHSSPKNVRTQQKEHCNSTSWSQRASYKNSNHVEVWGHFFDTEMINITVKYTNQHIRISAD